MSRGVQLVLLCEDTQHETFARRFLEKAGWSARRLRVQKAPKGRGSGAQFVRETFAKELVAYRTNRNRVAQALLVFIDGDNIGGIVRLSELEKICAANEIEPRQPDDRVAVFIPTWNIETWLAYLDGQNVDESRNDYPRLSRPRDCQKHVDRLFEMCKKGELRQPAPASIKAACEEFQSRLRQ